MSKIDANGNVHGRDGRFIPKHSFAAQGDAVIELKKTSPIVRNPKDIVIKDSFSEYPTVDLPLDEYNMVMSELATNLTEEEHEQPIISKSIRNYTYTVVIRGFGDYRIIDRTEIVAKKRGTK